MVAFDVDGGRVRLYTDSVLAALPTPDFSMPYNVITLTSTVLALFFGSVFNLLTRQFRLVPPGARPLHLRLLDRLLRRKAKPD